MSPRRGTSNSSTRGSSYDRQARRAWLMEKFGNPSGKTIKCFWCPKVMHTRWEVDRYPICGHDGGRYTRDNIVPAVPALQQESLHHREEVPRWERPQAGTMTQLSSLPCPWCGLPGGSLPGKGVSANRRLHKDCRDAVELFFGWDRPIPAPTK